jgi:hypothetical protein
VLPRQFHDYCSEEDPVVDDQVPFLDHGLRRWGPVPTPAQGAARGGQSLPCGVAHNAGKVIAI